MATMDDENFLDQPFDASDAAQVQQRKMTAGRRAKALKDVTQNLMSTANGRMWVWELLKGCLVFDRTFTGEPITGAFNEGARSVGLAIMKQIDPAALALMMKESNE